MTVPLQYRSACFGRAMSSCSPMFGLWVVCYNSGIGLQNHELALVSPVPDSEVHYLFGTRTYQSSVQDLQKKSIYVDKRVRWGRWCTRLFSTGTSRH